MPASPHNLRDLLIERVRKTDVSDNPALEESERTNALGAIDDLVWDHEVAGLDLLLQRADGREGNDAADAEGAESGDVGAVRDFVGGEGVVGAVAGEEGDGGVLVGEDRDGGGRCAPGSGDVQGGDGGVPFEPLEASSADDGNVNFTLEGLISGTFQEQRREGYFRSYLHSDLVGQTWRRRGCANSSGRICRVHLKLCAGPTTVLTVGELLRSVSQSLVLPQHLAR